jgi:hypothetical protein
MWPFFSRKLSAHLKKYSPPEPEWFFFALNQGENERPNLIMLTRTTKTELKLQWQTLNSRMRVDIFDETHRFGRMVNPESAQSYFFFTHLSLKNSLDRLKALSLENAGAVTALDLTQEGRAIEWLRVSLKVLKDALESCRSDESKVVRAMLYVGKEAAESRPLFRAIIFNLDITCVFDPQGVMGLVVFDDKNRSHGTSQKPALEASFKGLKPAVLDELITLSATLMSVVEEKTLKLL